MDLQPDSQTPPGERPIAPAGARLLLSFQQDQLSLEAGQEVLLGSTADCDLHIERRYVSRRHLVILRRDRYFVAIDQSTNGTFLQAEDLTVTHFKRSEQRLWGSGWLCLGEPLRPDAVVHFQQVG
ncbi:MAG: FHA domain-containing protein [Pseudomonadota bacterium]